MRERLQQYLSSLVSSPAAGFAAFAGLVGFALAAYAPQIFRDGDSWWHLAAGQWMLAHGVPHTDPFGMGGGRWQAQEWLAEIIMAVSYHAAGWTGLHLLFGLAMGATAAILGFALRRRMEAMPALLALVIGLGLVTGSLLARPHMLALPLLALWTAMLVLARTNNTAPSWWLILVMPLWANLHGSFLFGPALAGALTLEAMLSPASRPAAPRWAVFTLVSLAACLMAPEMLEGVLFPIRLLFMPGIAGIGEWQPSDVTHLNPLVLALAASLYVFVRVRLPVFRGLLFLGLVYLALAHARHQIILGVAGPLLLSPYMGAAWPTRSLRPSPWPARAAAFLFAVMLLARLSSPTTRGEDRVTPAAALTHVPQTMSAQPVLNAYDYGGYLIFEGVRVFIDGRTDIYGTDYLKNYDALAAGDTNALSQTLARYNIAWTIFPDGSPTVAALDKMPGWHRAYGDANAVVHLRD